jgi:hypothetical protein
VYRKKQWLTLQEEEEQLEEEELEEELAEVDSDPVATEGGIAGEDAVDEGPAEAATELKRRNGSRSPSWADWSRLGKSQVWSRSTFTLSRSKNIRLWISFSQS